MGEVPEYIRKRMLSSSPEDCCVRPCTVPQIFEGFLDEAKVATVGINPHGARDCKKYSPKGICAMDEEGVRQAYKDKRHFFDLIRYAPYFDPLEQVLNECGASFGGLYGRKPSAVSLDLAQWATNPSPWSALPRRVQWKLLDDGREFFTALLEQNDQIRLVLATSRAVVDELWIEHKVPFTLVDTLRVPGYTRAMRVFCAETGDRQFIGWNWPLSRMGTKMKQDLAKRVGELYRNGC